MEVPWQSLGGGGACPASRQPGDRNCRPRPPRGFTPLTGVTGGTGRLTNQVAGFPFQAGSRPALPLWNSHSFLVPTLAGIVGMPLLHLHFYAFAYPHSQVKGMPQRQRSAVGLLSEYFPIGGRPPAPSLRHPPTYPPSSPAHHANCHH